MTRDEFIEGYCDRSDITVDKFHDLGLDAIPCDCHHDNCKGWQCIHKPNHQMLEELEDAHAQ